MNYMHSQGLMKRWRNEYWPPIHSCVPGGQTVLTLSHVQGIFYVLAIGIILAGLVLVLEVGLSGLRRHGFGKALP